MSFIIDKDALLPAFQRTLLDEDGDVVDLSLASGVKLRLRRKGDSEDTFINPAAIVDAVNGKVRYTWSVGDTDEAGEYEATWLVTQDGKDMPYPNGEPEPLTVFADDEISDDDLVFCDTAGARGVAREDFDADELFKAQLILSLRTGVLPETDPEDPTDWDNLSFGDRTGLMIATVMQAKWMRGQYDLFERVSVTSESADGASVQYANSLSLYMAPMAEAALTSTSWNTSGYSTINTPPARYEGIIPLGLDDVGWREQSWSQLPS